MANKIKVKISAAFNIKKDEKLAKLLQTMIDSEINDGVFENIISNLVRAKMFFVNAYGSGGPDKLWEDIMSSIIDLRINDYKRKTK